MAEGKAYTLDKLQKRIGRIRKIGAIFAPSYFKPGVKSVDGKEVFLETEKGKVRVLTYNMDEKEILPLFINIHGSGFVFGNAEMDDPFMPRLAKTAGVKIISIDYCLAPEHPFPEAIEECYAVALYAKSHPDEFGIDPNRIAVGGHSAGGNFTAAIQLMDKDRQKLGLKCLILDYPPLDVYTDASEKPKGTIPVKVSRMFDACYCVDAEKRKNPLISPLFATKEQLETFPPTLIITASKDSLCKEGELFCERLIESGVKVSHKRYEAHHGFNLSPGTDSDDSWLLMAEFLKMNLA
ncbi:MAG: alpha/beta hydrolase [Candidatus Ornithospirochaeta sp.]